MSLVRLKLLTAGESHGPAQCAILEGFPADLPVSLEALQFQMKRRQSGYGRGGRMKIETDEVEVLSGVRHGRTLGSPIGLLVRNRDFENWTETMAIWDAPSAPSREIHRPRPGHADLAGGMKYGQRDLRNILERASARETVMRVAAGMICRQFLIAVGIEVASHVLAIGGVQAATRDPDWESIAAVQPSEQFRCVDSTAEEQMIAAVDEAKQRKDTLGGIVQIVARGVPPGLGSHVHWDRRLDGRIAQALLSIPSAKGVSVGDAFQVARRWGSEAHDEIFHDPAHGLFRKTNRAGGIEGGITNGEELRIDLAFKPLSTLMKPLLSVDLRTRQAEAAAVERSDVCAVPAGGVVAEAMLCLVLMDAVLEKFGGDTFPELSEAIALYRKRLQKY